MSVDMFLRLGDLGGEAQHKPKEIEKSPTVQLGENSLSQVAARLGIEKDHLLQANPHIKDPSNLKVGQEIHVPTHPTPKSESSVATPPVTVHAKDFPTPPIGDPLAASAMRAQIDGATFPPIGTHGDGKSDPEVDAGGADIESLVFLTMMQASKGAQQDLQQIMNEVKAINQSKSKLRSEIDEIQDLAAGQDVKGTAENNQSEAANQEIDVRKFIKP